MMIKLLSWRLQYFARVTLNLILRRWQVLLLLALLLSPMDMGLLAQIAVLAKPVGLMLSPGKFVLSAEIWFAIVASALAYSTLQAQALFGNAYWEYLSTFPISSRYLRLIDLILLTIVDLPIFIPFLAAEIVTLNNLHINQAGLLPWLFSCLLFKFHYYNGYIEKNQPKLLLCVLLNLVALYRLSVDSSVILLLISFSIALWACFSSRYLLPKKQKILKLNKILPLKENLSVLMAFIFINIRSLFLSNVFLENMGLWVSASLPVLIYALIPTQLSHGYLYEGILLATLIPLVFSLSSLNFRFEQLHQPMQGYIKVLGLKPQVIGLSINCTIQLMYIFLCLPLLVMLYTYNHSMKNGLLMPAGIVFLFVSQKLNQKLGNQAIIPKFLLSVLMVYLLMSYIDGNAV